MVELPGGLPDLVGRRRVDHSHQRPDGNRGPEVVPLQDQRTPRAFGPHMPSLRAQVHLFGPGSQENRGATGHRCIPKGLGNLAEAVPGVEKHVPGSTAPDPGSAWKEAPDQLS